MQARAGLPFCGVLDALGPPCLTANVSLRPCMPINIYSENTPEKLAYLCDSNWRLPDQVEALEIWLKENRSRIKSGGYVADIGFTLRQDASGGGAAISPEMMRTMADLGMSLFLSEYPGENELLRYPD